MQRAKRNKRLATKGDIPSTDNADGVFSLTHSGLFRVHFALALICERNASLILPELFSRFTATHPRVPLAISFQQILPFCSKASNRQHRFARTLSFVEMKYPKPHTSLHSGALSGQTHQMMNFPFSPGHFVSSPFTWHRSWRDNLHFDISNGVTVRKIEFPIYSQRQTSTVHAITRASHCIETFCVLCRRIIRYLSFVISSGASTRELCILYVCRPLYVTHFDLPFYF